MEPENKFFVWLWRLNAIVIAMAGILVIGLLLFLGYKQYRELRGSRPAHTIVNIDENTQINEDWRLGQFSQIRGANVMMGPLYANQIFSQEYYSKHANSTRNYLFIDIKTLAAKWLLPHNRYLITQMDTLKLDDKNAAILAILFHIVVQDSDKDNRLTNNDLKTIAITRPDGSHYREIFTGIQRVISHKVLHQTELLLIYAEAGSHYGALFNLRTHQLSQTAELPAIASTSK